MPVNAGMEKLSHMTGPSPRILNFCLEAREQKKQNITKLERKPRKLYNQQGLWVSEWVTEWILYLPSMLHVSQVSWYNTAST